MYGLEKKRVEKFEFDLEKEIKQKPAHGKKILDKVHNNINDIKKQLREGQNEKSFEKLGILLHGYAALQKVLKKATK